MKRKTALKVVPAKQLPAVASAPTSLLEVISHAARDPSVDVSKMERLMDMHERITAKKSEEAFNQAMTACQSEMKRVLPDADNNQTRSKYATYAKLDAYMRPIYIKHGFSLSFDEGETVKPDIVRVVCYVAHTAGHSRTYHRDIPADGKGAKGGDVMTKTHAAGAAGSYGARYLLRGIFNIAVGADDNDGNVDDVSGMDDGLVADHLAAIESCADIPSLQKAFAAAWTLATKAKDKPSQRRFTEAKDARKAALGVKS